MDELDNLRGLVEEKNKEIRELEDEIDDLKMEVNTLEDKIEEAHNLGYIIMKKAEEVLDI
jgi:peptidoglycan hydrolase CwlO-like protein